MNVLVLNPPFKGRFSRTSRSPAVTLGGTIYYPFWLAYAAGVLEQNGFAASLIDAPAQGLSVDDVLARAKDSPPQLIVVDTSTPSIYSDVQVAEKLKENFPGSFVTLVGTHPSALPEATLALSEKVDAVAVGEYEIQKYHIGVGAVDLLQRLGRCRHRHNVKAAGGKSGIDHLPRRCIVIYYQYGWTHVVRSPINRNGHRTSFVSIQHPRVSLSKPDTVLPILFASKGPDQSIKYTCGEEMPQRQTDKPRYQRPVRRHTAQSKD